MTTTAVIALLIVLVALIFDFTNGFHDAANSIATVVSTRVLSPRYAVIWAATFNFVAFAIFGTRVAKTIGGDLVRIDLIREDLRLYVLCAGLIGAIAWNLVTWYLGLPTSSSHALVGGYAGAAIVAYRGISGLLKPAGWIKTLTFIVHDHARGLLDFSARHAVASGQDISSRSVVVCCRLLTGPWRQRRAKNDGHRYGGARHGRSFQFAFGR